MHPPPRLSAFWAVAFALLLVYVWTWTESATVTLRVADDLCAAQLYGRATTIPCSGLAGGELATFTGKSTPPIGRGRGPLDRLAPGSAWGRLEVRDEDGRLLATDEPLPDSFMVTATLRRPNEPAGLVLLPPGSDTGWVFLPDGETRRGIWGLWADAEPAASIRGIPFDKPLIAQTQSFLRLLLDGWQGAVLLFVAAWGVTWLVERFATRKSSIFPTPASWPVKLLLLPAILFTFAVSLHVALDVLEGIPHVQDSVTYLFQAQTLARGDLTAPAPPLAGPARSEHFNQEFLLVRDGRWFGKYPPGYPAVLAIGVLAGGHWLVNPLLAALTLPLLYALAKILYADERPKNFGVLAHACLLLTVSPFFLVMSGSFMAHAAELFWTALFMVAWARAVAGGRGRWAVAAGVALGMLYLTRQFTALTVGLSFGVGWAMLSRRQAGRAAHFRSAVPRLLLFAAPFGLALLGYQAVVTGDAFTDPRLLYWPYDRVGFGPGIGEAQNVFTFVPTSAGPAQQWAGDPAQPPRGNSPSLGLYNLGRNFSALQGTLFAWPPLLTLSLVWLAFLLRRPVAADWVLLVMAAAIAGGYIAYWAAGIAYGPRYFYAALPALILLSGRGLSALAAATSRRATAILLLALVGYSFVALPAHIEAYRGYNFVSGEPRAAIEQAINGPALVFVSVSDTDWWEYGAFFSGNTPWLDGEFVYARDRGQAANEALGAAFPGRAAYVWRAGQLIPLSP
jgi:hypothetical protein